MWTEIKGNALLDSRIYQQEFNAWKFCFIKRFQQIFLIQKLSFRLPFQYRGWVKSPWDSSHLANVIWVRVGPSRVKLPSQPSWALADNPCNWSWRACLLQTKKTSQKELSKPNLWGVWAEVPIQSYGGHDRLLVKLNYNKRVKMRMKAQRSYF